MSLLRGRAENRKGLNGPISKSCATDYAVKA